MAIARVLISITIKNLVGLAEGVIPDAVDAAMGLAGIANENLSEILKNSLVKEKEDIGEPNKRIGVFGTMHIQITNQRRPRTVIFNRKMIG